MNKRASRMICGLAAFLTGLTVVLIALPTPTGEYAVHGVAVTADTENAQPIDDIAIEVHRIEAGGLEVPSAIVPVSNRFGEFVVPALSTQHSYRIVPKSSDYTFEPPQLLLEQAALRQLVVGKTVIEGFVFEGTPNTRAQPNFAAVP